MRNFAVILFTVCCLNTSWAQSAAKTDSIAGKKHKLSASIEVKLDNDDKKDKNGGSDTTRIRLGKKEVVIIESGNNKHVDILKTNDEDKWKKKHEDNNDEFDGHWAGFELGVNSFANEDYSMYNGVDFMNLNQSKSLEVNINFWEYNISLQQNRKNIGLVTGMGLSYNNYRFDGSYSIKKENGIIQPVELEEGAYKKSKFTVTYLTVPLMLECQIPVNNHSNKIFVSGGVEGGLNIGAHTKIKWDDKKEKERGGFNLNTLKYAVVGRIGLKNISLYASYNLTPLFKDGKGPDLTPFTIGIGLINF